MDVVKTKLETGCPEYTRGDYSNKKPTFHPSAKWLQVQDQQVSVSGASEKGGQIYGRS